MIRFDPESSIAGFERWSKKDKDMIQKKMAEFDAKLVHYGHTNVSEFLKERY